MEEMRASRSLQIARVDNLQLSVVGIGRRLRSARKRQARLELLTELRPAWNKMLELQRQMAELPRLPYMHDDPMISLDTASSVLSMTRARAEAARATEEQRIEEIDAIQPSDDELAELVEIENLLEGRDEFNALVGQTEDTEAKDNTSRAELESRLSQIEGGWTVERAQKFAAEVRPGDIDLHEAALDASQTKHTEAEKDLREAGVVLGQAEAKVTTAELRLGQLNDVAEDHPEELESLLDILNRLKSNLLAITTKRAEVASIEVQRTEAAQIGSGVNHMMIMVQLGASGLFALIGTLIWAWASIDGDSMTARTGLVMTGSGIVGVAFGATYLQLQHRPSATVMLDSQSGANQAPTTIRGHIVRAAQVNAVVAVSTIQRLVRIYKARRATAAAKKGLTGIDDATAKDGSSSKASAASKPDAAETTKSSFSFMGIISKLREMNRTPAEDDEDEPVEAVAKASDESEVPEESDDDSDPDESADSNNEDITAGPEKSRSPFGILELIAKLRKMNSEPVEAESEDDSDDEESDASESGQSPFGIMELIGKFTSFGKSDEASADSDEDEDEDALLKTIAAEIDEEETDSEDDEDVADAIAQAQSDVPEDLREAQDRADDDDKPGLISGLIGKIMAAQKKHSATKNDVGAELSDDEEECGGSGRLNNDVGCYKWNRLP
jgi:hypothetical protein